jgi:hypothetical protein
MTFQVCKTLQTKKPSERIINNCPSYDTDWAPVELLYPGFLVFQDIAIRHKILSEYASKINKDELELLMMKLRVAVSQYYSDKVELNEALLAVLNEMFIKCSNVDRDRHFIRGCVYKSCFTDGHLVGPHSTLYFMMEVKLDVGSVGEVPTNQSAAYFAQSAVKGHNDFSDLFGSWRVPAAVMVAHGM